jgi:hypothetical protein
VRRSGLFVLALASASVVACEVLVTRLLSVSTWYGLAFLVLSIAMLGITSGSLAALRAQAAGEPLMPWVASRLWRFAAGIVVATIVLLGVPLTFTPDAESLATIVLVVAAVTWPMVSGGSVVARLMAESKVALPIVYAVDLVAAAAGALVPLALLGPLTAPSALVALACELAIVAQAIAPKGSRFAPRAIAVLCFALVALTQTTSRGLVVRYAKGVARSEEAPPLFEAWNALSYVSLSPFAPKPFVMWSYGPKDLPRNHPSANALIDGEAATAVYAYSDVQQLALLKSDGTASAHAIRPDGHACVIGIGGGRDIEAALVSGHDKVFGFEINPSMIAMLQAVRAYSPLLEDPRVAIVVGDGRTEIARRPNLQCRVLQAALVDTWAATSAGAFAHTESTLYTKEAWALFLKRVEPDGVLTFSRWYEPTRLSETSRLVALAVASLLERRAERPRDHVALLAASKVATLLVSPSPFSEADRAKILLHAKDKELQVLLAPGAPSADPLLDKLLDAKTEDELAALGRAQDLDTSPSTDDRPFFFQMLAARAWLHPVAVTRSLGVRQGALSGNVASMFELLLTFVSVAIVGAFLLGPTLARAAKEEKPPLPGARATAYFGALGAGFMIAEIALMQRLHVVLGHPTYALVVVLASLLVATGVGSARSPRFVASERAGTIAGLVAAALLFAMPWAIIAPLARATADSPFAVKVAWTAACAGAIGVVLGTMFPSGIRYAERDRGAPVALAVNGATSVLGSVVAVIVSVWAGIPASFGVAAAIYVVAAMCGPSRWNA